METVLVVGATGNMGTAAVLGALAAGYKVLAIVRNTNSANKLFENVGSREGITTVEANVMSDTGVQSVVNHVKAGKLPSFQHVYAAGKYLSQSELRMGSTDGLCSGRNIFYDHYDRHRHPDSAGSHDYQLRVKFL
jgi:NAD(P)-dependent dehydrogenase (short-subunit alcohol dehydrogenase family)